MTPFPAADAIKFSKIINQKVTQKKVTQNYSISKICFKQTLCEKVRKLFKPSFSELPQFFSHTPPFFPYRMITLLCGH